MAQTKKKVMMPAGLRNKMMAAVAMLLVASILMVSSTYAWFTLSTAPEVTGISTSVGANGNLEIALLTTATHAAPATISSAQGDSMAAQAVTAANITWGNLVDLADEYGLEDITLLPATANYTTDAKTNLNSTNLLKYPVYGADGRVSTLGTGTVSAIKSAAATTTFTYNPTAPDYGVRAVGTSGNVSARTLAHTSAKGVAGGAAGTARSTMKATITNNKNQFVSSAMKIATSETPSYSEADIALMKQVATAETNALNAIVNAYANYILGKVAGAAETDEQFSTALSAINEGGFNLQNCTSASALAAKVSTYLAEGQGTLLANLATSQTNVANALNTLNNTEATDEQIRAAVAALVGTGSNVSAFDDNGDPVALTGTTEQLISALADGSLYLNGGELATIVANAGNIELTDVYGISIYAGTNPEGSKALDAISGTNFPSAPAADATATANITDFYGYVIDFAFRTNAADSYLKLQTAAANRVYSGDELAEGQGTATQGSGSTVTYALNSALNEEQATSLLENIRIVFFNPDDGLVYANARLNNIAVADGTATAKVQLYNAGASTTTYTAGKDLITVAGETGSETYTVNANIDLDGEGGEEPVAASEFGLTAGATITAEQYEAMPATSSVNTTVSGAFIPADDATATIVALNQNEIKFVSVLVYLDGETIQNSDVINAATSGTLNLNLQFSSSADLIPMNNTALKNMTP